MAKLSAVNKNNKRIKLSDKFYATGRRKNAIAKVWLTKGNGDIKINKKEISSYFPRETWVKHAIEALAILVASMFPGFVMSNIVLNSAISQMFVFNGYFITVGNMLPPMKAIYYVSPFAYTTHALFKIVFDETTT